FFLSGACRFRKSSSPSSFFFFYLSSHLLFPVNMLVLLDSAELHRRSSQFKEAVRWSGKAARLRSGWCGGRPTFWIKGLVGSSFSFSSPACPCCRRARGSVGVLLHLRSTSLRSGVANGGVVDLRWFGLLSGSQRRRVRKVFPSALSPDGQSFAVWARWDPSSHHRRKLWVSSSGRVPHPSVFCSGFALVNRSAFCSSGSGSRLCLAVVSLLLRFIPTFLRIEAMLFPLQCKGLGLLGALLQFLLLGLALSIGGLGLLGALLQFLLLGLALSIGVTALARLVETGPMLLLLDEFLNS
ncbi:LOW QUALITY PROTEIN: hypothetical protein HID58_066755, partial [Brassica napus]